MGQHGCTLSGVSARHKRRADPHSLRVIVAAPPELVAGLLDAAELQRQLRPDVPKTRGYGSVARRTCFRFFGSMARRADYLKGTVTGPGTLEKTAMKSRSSGVR
jgi:hypothetical protein